jgi:hypothetical protein
VERGKSRKKQRRKKEHNAPLKNLSKKRKLKKQKIREKSPQKMGRFFPVILVCKFISILV